MLIYAVQAQEVLYEEGEFQEELCQEAVQPKCSEAGEVVSQPGQEVPKGAPQEFPRGPAQEAQLPSAKIPTAKIHLHAGGWVGVNNDQG